MDLSPGTRILPFKWLTFVFNFILDLILTKLFTGSEALGKVFAMTSTNLPYTFLLTNGLSVLEGGQNGIERLTVPELGDWVDDYDVYGGQALRVDQKAYQNKLAQMGFR